MAGVNGQVEELAASALLPDNHGGIAGSLAVDEDFMGADDAGFGDLSQTDGDAYDRFGEVDQGGLAYGDGEIVRLILTCDCGYRDGWF